MLTCISLLILVGCQEEMIDGMSVDEGRLVLAGFNVKVGVEDVATRSNLASAPSKSDLTIKLTDKSNENNVITIPASTTDTVVPVGNYTLSASYGENVCSTTPYFYGSTDVEIVAQSSTTAQISVSLQSAVIHPIISESLQNQFKSFSLHVKCDNSEHASIAVGNDVDYFVPSGKDYTLSLTGTNMIGESKDIDVYTLNSTVAATRYNITCNPSLPSFTMPSQAETNAWSTFICITPMTSSNITSKADLTDKVLANIVYEAISGNDTIASTKDSSGNYKISGLKPSTTYTLRSRFGGVVSSNTVTLTTENGTALTNGNMDEWDSKKLKDAYSSGSIYLYSLDGWATRNEKTTDGVSSSNITNNVCTYWRWNSGTQSTNDTKSGSGYAAELSSLAFYSKSTSVVALTRSKIESNIKSNNNTYSAYLFLGTYNLSNDSYTLGISHDSRPLKLSFDYKYAPIGSDNAVITAAVYDASGNIIAELGEVNTSEQRSWVTQEINFIYTTSNTKAAKIHVFFQSGTNVNASTYNYVNGSYDATPYTRDRMVGSQLYIDNVKLIYE